MIMSNAYFASEWSTLEHHTLLFRDPTNAQRRFIPLLIEDCKLPDVIAQFAYIDWRQKSEEAYARLLAACRPVEESATELLTLKKRKKQTVDQAVMILKGRDSAVGDVILTPDGNRLKDAGTAVKSKPLSFKAANGLEQKMRLLTQEHEIKFESMLSEAFIIARTMVMDNLTKLYNWVLEEIPALPEVSISRDIHLDNLPSLQIQFQRKDKIRKLSFLPLKVLEPREEFPEGHAIRLINPFAVFVLKVESNARKVQHGHLYLEIKTPNRILNLNNIELEWKVGHLVCEAHPDVDRKLIRRILERVFVEID